MKKKILFSLLGTIVLCGCCKAPDEIINVKTPDRKCRLNCHNGKGWDIGISEVHCDSFQMEGTKKAYVWINGTKMKIEAEDVIYPTVK